MVNFFDKLYSSIVSKNAFLDKIRFYSVLRVIVRTTANIVLPIYFKLTAGNSDYMLIPTDKKEGRLIVSLTSFPARINKVWMSIETILRQTKKPDMIILWLSEEQFPTLESLPNNLLNLRKRGLTIELRSGNLRSHKKYYYTLQEYPDDIMITIDDDILYRADLIQNLLLFSDKYPNSVIANYGHFITYDKDGNILPYMKWEQDNDSDEIKFGRFFFGSGGGTLFPSKSFSSEVTNKELFQNLCPTADDIWLNAMCSINNVNTQKINSNNIFLPIQNKKNKTLSSNNISHGNDVQIDAVRKYCIGNYKKDPFKI